MPRHLKRIGVILPHPRHSHGPALFDGLRAAPCEPVALEFSSPWPGLLDAYLLYGPETAMGPMLERLQRVQTPRPHAIVWLTEQTPSPHVPARAQALLADTAWSGYWSLNGLRRIDQARWPGRLLRVLDTRAVRLRTLGALRRLQRDGWLRLLAVLAPSHQGFFARLGVPAAVVPFGYHPSFGEPLGLERDIDVVFLGSLRDRRRSRIAGALRAELKRRNIDLQIRDGSREGGYAYGDERTRLLNRARIMLSIMRQPWDDLVFRMLLAAPNGALLISEPVADCEPFAPERHFVMADVPHMADRVEYYLRHDDEREAIAGRARDFVVQQMSMPAMARRLLEAAGLLPT